VARSASPPGRPPTLSELARDVTAILVQCDVCRHEAKIPLAGLIERFGGEVEFPSLRSHFRCSACGGRKEHASPAWPVRQ
jgi:hypothetical protein